MSSRRDIGTLLDQAARAGCEVDRGGSGHWVIRKDGAIVATSSATPSDHRAVRNVRAELKRNGVDLTPPRKERTVPQPASQQQLVLDLENTMVDLGWRQEHKRHPALHQIVRKALAVAPAGATTELALSQAARQLRKGNPLTERNELLLRAGVDAMIEDSTNPNGNGHVELSAVPKQPRTRSSGRPAVDSRSSLSFRVLAAILDPDVTRDEAIRIAEDVDRLARPPITDVVALQDEWVRS